VEVNAEHRAVVTTLEERVAAEPVAGLRAHHLFEALAPAQFAAVTAGAEIVELAAGQMLFQRGDPAKHFYVVAAGEVKLALVSRSGEEKIVERLLPGHSFAEALMFVSMPVYPLAAIAVEPSRVIALDSAAFLGMLHASPDTCLRLLADLSRRLHARIREIEELTLESATPRLVRHFLSLLPPGAVAPAAISLDESRQMLASRLAIKPETLSRILRSLSDAGLIEVDGRVIRLVGLDRLQALA
jgi:CRP/FNR family transcriptional regulator, dissimilatory nitrate respiration regulator